DSQSTEQRVFTLEGHSGPIRPIAWSIDGSLLASSVSVVRAPGQCVLPLHINSPDFLQFDKVNSDHLRTRTGTLDIGSIASVTFMPHRIILSPKQYGYGLSHDLSWITYNEVNLLWLPTEFRPQGSSRFAMSATNLATGCSSGHVIFLTLRERGPVE
ncbi:hypothetical protein N7537_011435, partial [Penicillium hordei]